MRVPIIIILFMCLFLGCQQRGQEKTSWSNIVSNDLESIEILGAECEIVSFTRDMIHARDFLVYCDSILIVVNSPSSEFMIEVYNMNSRALLTRKIHHGNGPYEMLNCKARVDGQTLRVRDFVKKNYVLIDLDDIIEKRDEYKLGEIKSYRDNISVSEIQDVGDKLLCLNPYCFYSEELGIGNNVPRFFYKGDELEMSKKYNAYNVSQGHILINHKDSLILFAGLCVPEMEIYDFHLNPKVKVEGPTKLDIAYALNDGRVTFSKTAFFCYLGIQSCEEGFYATYQGSEIEKGDRTYILRYNWKGEILRAYVADKYLASISTTSDEKVLYVRGQDENGTVLYKVSLD